MALEALKRNGHNLQLGGYETDGPTASRALRQATLDGTLSFIPFNCAKTDSMRARHGVHFFIDDYLFERVWKDPARYAQMLMDFRAVMTPDFSLFTDYPVAVQLYNHWRKHLLGAYWQRMGMTVIPSICWSDESSFDWCFDGEPAGRHGGGVFRGHTEESKRQTAVSAGLQRDAPAAEAGRKSSSSATCRRTARGIWSIIPLITPRLLMRAKRGKLWADEAEAAIAEQVAA